MVSVGGLSCKRCGLSDYARSGVVRGHQRYRCRGCGCHFTDTPLRGKPAAMKALAVLLYGMGGTSFSMIGRVLGVSDVAVLKWVRAEAAGLPEPEVPATAVTVEIDEMWHFIKKSLPSCGSGEPMTWIAGAVAWVLGGRDDATLRRLLDKVGVEGKTFVTDDWEGYHRVILPGQLFTGKDLTFPIEQDNSNVRHCLARFRRRTKVVSKCRTMVDLSLRLLHHLQQPVAFALYAQRLADIFG